MNKRLIALFLCLVMLLSVGLASCADSTEEDAKEELEQAKVASNMTLTMWIVSESPVSDSIRNDVTKAINALTRAKYKTQLEIYYLSEEEYFGKITEAMEAFSAAKKQQNAGKPAQSETTKEDEAGTTAEEIITDEHGMYRDNYPVVLKNQVDIIYIGDVEDGEGNLLMSGQEMYNKLRAGDWLAALDETIKGDAKKLKEFVSPTLLSAVQEKGVTYAIPNNNVIGEYTFMCLNKTLMERYSLQGHLTRGSIKSFANQYVYQFIDQIARYETDILPIDATYEECLAQLAYYWNIDPEDYSINSDQFSIFGTPLFSTQPNRGQNAVGVQSLLENEEFAEHYLAINEYRLGKMYHYLDTDEENPVVFFRNEDNKDKTFGSYGIKFVKGSLAELNSKGNYVDENGVEYYAVPVSYPTATAEDIYGNMFAVAKTTLDVERSMQIITYLNTNAEIRNLLQYGIQGQHYTIENGVVKRAADKNNNYYMMDLEVTGNAFIAHREPGTNASIWENGKNQNRDSLVAPMLGFDLVEYAESATTFGTPVVVTNTKTYQTTFLSGLSKEVLSEDAELKAWLEASQAPGVYVFRSREKTLNNEYVEVLYFYNNTGAYRFGVQSDEVPKEGGSGYYRNNTYTYVEDETLSEYEKEKAYTLTMVYDVCMTRYEGSYKVLQNGAEQPHIETFKYTEKTYNFDIYDTQSYKLDVYGDLYLGDFYDNKEIFSQLSAFYDKLVKKPTDLNVALKKTNVGFFWKDETSSETKNYYNIILYRANTSVATTFDVVPTISGNKISLSVNYTEYAANKIEDPSEYKTLSSITRPGKRYLLHYLTLETDKDLELDTYLTEEGEEQAAIFYNLSQTTSEELQNGPLVHQFGVDTDSDDLIKIDYVDFDIHGFLNTEVVKYMAELNDIALSLLNSCKTNEELKKMVGHLGLLFNTEEKLVNLYSSYGIDVSKMNDADNVDKNFVAVTNDPNSIVYEKNFGELFYQLTHITNYGTTEEVIGTPSAISQMAIYQYNEFRSLAYSPFGIYYLWMEAYQYLPADMQPTE